MAFRWFRDINTQWPQGADGGITAMKEKNTFYRGGVPHFDFTVLKQLVVADHIVCHWEGDGTHQGEFGRWAPTGRPVWVEASNGERWRGGEW